MSPAEVLNMFICGIATVKKKSLKTAVFVIILLTLAPQGCQQTFTVASSHSMKTPGQQLECCGSEPIAIFQS